MPRLLWETGLERERGRNDNAHPELKMSSDPIPFSDQLPGNFAVYSVILTT